MVRGSNEKSTRLKFEIMYVFILVMDFNFNKHVVKIKTT